eukprot:TRINITY_DN1913_c0_g1_i1.p1 TRINITY_DN1913_c0_g1~~TRINITY_DN1913_c0_g1_i1.p1  ORF type:complete len:1241 (+),score=218.25 TRINITY_DN1913_c0_g1_i1:529-4251(+)
MSSGKGRGSGNAGGAGKRTNGDVYGRAGTGNGEGSTFTEDVKRDEVSGTGAAKREGGTKGKQHRKKEGEEAVFIEVKEDEGLMPGMGSGDGLENDPEAAADTDTSEDDDDYDGQEVEKAIVEDTYKLVDLFQYRSVQYVDLFRFLLYTVLYIVILFMQANQSRVFQVSTSHFSLLPEGVSDDGSFDFNYVEDIYEWLNDTIVQHVWAPAACGNGICEMPEEEPGWGRFGCAADCGFHRNVSRVTVSVTADFKTAEERNASSWNLCTVRRRTPLCWYEDPVKISSLHEKTSVSLAVPDGDWELVLDAPYGGVTGSIQLNGAGDNDGRKTVPPQIVEREAGSVLAEWGGCYSNVSDSPLGRCRKVAAHAAECARHHCTMDTTPLISNMSKSGLLVDLFSLCDTDFGVVEGFEQLDSCSEVIEMLNTEGFVFEGITCGRSSATADHFLTADASGTGRAQLLETISMPSTPFSTKSAVLSTECAPGCQLGYLKNGRCDVACDNMDCAFDGDDCASPRLAVACPWGQAKAEDGSCCQANNFGSNLRYKFQLRTFSGEDGDDGPYHHEGVNVRYVSLKNRVMIGMLLSQTRWGSDECNSRRFYGLYPKCTEGTSTSKFGVNPVFLPTSDLYNEYYAKNATLYYEDWGLSYDNSTIFNEKGIPYGFEPNVLGQEDPTFQYLFDINFNPNEAQESLQFLKDGFFIDNSTKELSVRLITYNGVDHFFSLFEITLSFEVGGNIELQYNVDSVNPEPYKEVRDWVRMTLEVVFFIAVCGNLWGEAVELRAVWREKGTPLAYFNVGNLIDHTSLVIMVTGIFLWLHFILFLAQPFATDMRYDVYDINSWVYNRKFWDISKPGTEFANAVNTFGQVQAMIDFHNYYFALQGINVLFMVLRILKLMDFQPRMGTVTRTIVQAGPDLLHFFILYFVLFGGFAMYGHLVFGRTIEEFCTIGLSMVTCFNALTGDTGVTAKLIQQEGWELVAAVVFWWSYVMIMVFIFLNLLLAIIVGAFERVRDMALDNSYPMHEEVVILTRLAIKRLLAPKSALPVKTQLKLLATLREQNQREHISNYTCTKCEVTPIKGARYLAKLSNKNLCPNCFKKYGRDIDYERVTDVPKEDDEVPSIYLNNNEYSEKELERIYRRIVSRKRHNIEPPRKGLAKKIATSIFNEYRDGLAPVPDLDVEDNEDEPSTMGQLHRVSKTINEIKKSVTDMEKKLMGSMQAHIQEADARMDEKVNKIMEAISNMRR